MEDRTFEIKEDSGNIVKLTIRTPEYDDYEAADKAYASKVATLVRESGGKRLLLRSQVDEFLKSAGVWTEQDEQAVQTLQNDIETLLDKLRKGGLKLSEGRQLAIDVMDKRKEIVHLMQKRQIFDDTTIESIAESEKLDYIIFASTVYEENGKSYWDSFEDMKNDKLSAAYQLASLAVHKIVYNVNPEFEKKLPENRWLKKYGFVDENLNYVDRKTGEKVDKQGKPLGDLEAKLQKAIENLNGELQEEQPFIDDDTSEPVVLPTTEV
jgi:hypothetical protein